MSLLVVAVKLCHGFDSREARPRRDDEPAALAIDWDTWRSNFSKGPFLAEASHIDTTEEDVCGMDGAQLDEYLDWYERTWVDEAQCRREIMLSFFFSFCTETYEGELTFFLPKKSAAGAS
jgi:RNA polymerase I-specific transcription initiation factor RRN7